MNETNVFKNNDDIQVFIDGIEIKEKKSIYSHMVSKGTHILRIEQVRLYKSKYPYALMPLYILDLSLLDNSPLYVVYEVEIYVDKDIDITATLESKYLKQKGFVRVHDCKLNVIFNNELKRHLLRNDFTATDTERKRWFILYIIFTSLPTSFLICLFSLLTFYGIKQSKPLIWLVFCISISVVFIFALIFLLKNSYANYKNTNSKYDFKPE